MDRAGEEATAAARQQGRAEAEAFVQALRAAEDAAIEARLAGLGGAPPGDGSDLDELTAAPTEIARLRSQVESLAAFRTAVLSSSAWRAVQSLRRLFGRAW